MFQEQPFLKKQLYIVSYVIGGLLFQHGIRAGEPYAGVDIEELLNAIVALSDRSRSEDDVAPFIQQWHPMVDSLSAGFPTGLGLPDLYSNVATIMQQMLVPLTWLTDAADVKYLSPLLRLLQRQNRLVIGTLNYDNSIELLAQSHGLPCNTGIQDWSETGSVNVTSNGLHLLKLHGSVDWQRYRQEISDAKPMPTSAFRVLDKDVLPNMSEQHYPEVVFGGRNKLTAGGPYLDLFQAFKKELDQVEILTIVGYSFRDVHINTCITNWLNQGADHRIRIIRRNFDTDMGLYPDMLRRHASERLDVVKASAGEGLSFLYPDIA